MNRRKFLRFSIGGCGGAVLLGIGRAGQVGLLRPSEAYEGWSNGRLRQGLRAVVATGVLAANPHDSQPWKFRLGHDRIDVHLDLGRALGPVDPFLRQMHIGIGCALENLLIGASMQGSSASVDLFPDSNDATLAARLTLFGRDALLSPHASAVAQRHTNRGPYDPTQKLRANVAASLRAQAHDEDTAVEVFDAASVAGRAFADAISTATESLIHDEAFMRATDAWFRWTPREVREHRDGPSLGCAGLSLLTRVAAQLGPRPSAERFDASWLASTRQIHLATAPSFGVISVRDPRRAEQLVEAGRLWQRVHLEATLHGLAMQPLDQWLEWIDRTRERGMTAPTAGGLAFAPSGFAPVMMFRAGIPLRVAPASARRRLDDVLVS